MALRGDPVDHVARLAGLVIQRVQGLDLVVESTQDRDAEQAHREQEKGDQQEPRQELAMHRRVDAGDPVDERTQELGQRSRSSLVSSRMRSAASIAMWSPRCSIRCVDLQDAPMRPRGKSAALRWRSIGRPSFRIRPGDRVRSWASMEPDGSRWPSRWPWSRSPQARSSGTNPRRRRPRPWRPRPRPRPRPTPTCGS